MELSRWQNFSKREQLLMIGSEIMRADVWESKDNDKFKSALERAIVLVDLTLKDSKWRDGLAILITLKDELSKLHRGTSEIKAKTLYLAL